MSVPRFFVDRPIFAAVLSIVITLVGALAYWALPVAQYPEVAPPTVIVTASYPGADAQTLAETVATPLEQEINGVERMLYVSSSSTSDGRVQITITFELGTDLDKSQVLVQNRVNSALPRLPEDVRRQGIIARKQSPDLTLAVQFFSPDGSRDVAYLANFVTLQVRDRVSRVKGVADANSLGGQDFTMRIWLDPEKLAGHNLTAGDVTRALREQNLQIAGGSLGQPPAPRARRFNTRSSRKGACSPRRIFEMSWSEQGRTARSRASATSPERNWGRGITPRRPTWTATMPCRSESSSCPVATPSRLRTRFIASCAGCAGAFRRAWITGSTTTRRSSSANR